MTTILDKIVLILDPTAEIRSKSNTWQRPTDERNSILYARIALGVGYSLGLLALAFSALIAVGVISFFALPITATICFGLGALFLIGGGIITASCIVNKYVPS